MSNRDVQCLQRCRLETTVKIRRKGMSGDWVSRSFRHQTWRCALGGIAFGSTLTLPDFLESQASSSLSSMETGVGGKSSEEAEVDDDPLPERMAAGLLLDDEATGAKTLLIAG